LWKKDNAILMCLWASRTNFIVVNEKTLFTFNSYCYRCRKSRKINLNFIKNFKPIFLHIVLLLWLTYDPILKKIIKLLNTTYYLQWSFHWEF
jgi:hypothetical protein